MKKIAISNKFLLTTAAISLMTIVLTATAHQQLAQSQTQIYKMANGLNVCFQRVSQSFTALMVRDLNSSFLSEEFRNLTGECFGQVSNEVQALGVDSSLGTTLNNMVSDSHWFGEKVQKVADQASNSDVDLFQSNVIGKYESLESLKMEVEEGLIQTATNSATQSSLFSIVFILAQLTLLVSIVGLFIRRKLMLGSVSQVEAMVAKHNQQDDHLLAQKVIKNLFDHLDMKKTRNFLTQYLSSVIEENYRVKDHLVRANTIGDRFEIDTEGNEINIPILPAEKTSDFNVSLGTVLEKVQEKAFNHGIILDAKVDSDFHVKADSEALDQFLFYIISFAMDCSLEHNEGRKVIISGKPLGGIAYCKIKIAGHAFDNEQFAIINGKDANQNTNINLVLLKELIKDSNARLAVKNRQNATTAQVESEVELIFDRANNVVQNKASKSKIVKGKKEDIRRYFDRHQNQAF